MHLSSSQPSRRLLLAVMLVSAAVLGFEVALTRLFSVLLRYHFAFLSISMALCGLGLGGYLVHWLRRRRPIDLPLTAIGFGLGIDLAVALMLRVVFALAPDRFWMAALLVLIPFTLAGLFLAEVFARYPGHSGIIYAWDLAGAAFAALGVLVLLQIMGAIDACLAIAALAGIGGVALFPGAAPSSPGSATPGSPSAAPRSRQRSAVLAILFSLLPVLLGANLWRGFLDIPPIPPCPDEDQQTLADRGVTQPLFTELGTPGHTSRIIDTRWNVFARTDVVQDTTEPGNLFVYTNGNVPTNMLRWDGNLKTIYRLTRGFPLNDWAFSMAPLGRGTPADILAGKADRHGRVLSIGPGGGVDALLALEYGAVSFDGAELNPSIVGLMHDYRDWNGDIYGRPEVHVVTAEGRSFVRQAAAHGRHYALIYSALTKTATAGQGMALLESFIYTTDAYRDDWQALDYDGTLVQITDQVPMACRLFINAVVMLQGQGIGTVEACRHLALVADPRPGPYRFALVMQKTPISPGQADRMARGAVARKLSPLWIPGQAARSDFAPIPALAAGQLTVEDFIQGWRKPSGDGIPLDVSPCTDDRPFVMDLNVGQPLFFKQMAASAVLGSLILAGLGWRASRRQSSTGLPLPGEWKPPRTSSRTRSRSAAPAAVAGVLYLLYFACLAVGFMLVEIPLIQKLTLPLGYPTLAMTVALVSLLLGGGGGAWISQQIPEGILRRRAVGGAIAVAGAGVLVAMMHVPRAVMLVPLPLRCTLAILLLLPLGFLLGTPFPAGLRLFARRYPANVPLVWGLNGVTSVVGSLAAAMGAKAWGFDRVLVTGAGIYLAAALLLYLARSEDDEN